MRRVEVGAACIRSRRGSRIVYRLGDRLWEQLVGRPRDRLWWHLQWPVQEDLTCDE